MNHKDYYTILGVPATATPDEIRKAYRKLALKYHPDKTKGNSAANEKFMEINEANQVLGDAEKKKKYDQFNAERKHYEENGAQRGGFDWSKYAQGNGEQQPGMSAEDLESMFNAGGEVDLFELLFGGRKASRPRGTRTARRGEDLNAQTTLSLEEAYHGSVRHIQLDGQIIKVTIPPGIANEQVLRIAGQGVAAYDGAPKGDLYLTIQVVTHNEYVRKGNDLHRVFPIDLYTAILGGKALVKTLKGAVKVDIRSETPNHKELRLRGLGMPVFNKKDQFGDLFVSIDIKLPDHLSAKEIELYTQLAALRK